MSDYIHHTGFFNNVTVAYDCLSRVGKGRCGILLRVIDVTMNSCLTRLLWPHDDLAAGNLALPVKVETFFPCAQAARKDGRSVELENPAFHIAFDGVPETFTEQQSTIRC